MKLFIVAYIFIFSGYMVLNQEHYGADSDLSHRLQKFDPMHYRSLHPGQLQRIISNFTDQNDSISFVVSDIKLCEDCKLLAAIFIWGFPTDEQLATVLCKIHTLGSRSFLPVCNKIMEENFPMIDYIRENSQILDPDLTCSILLQNKKCYNRNVTALNWKHPAPPALQINSTAPPPIYICQAKPLKILHLSDLHISFNYEINGVEDCEYPLCCKKNLGNESSSKRAGVWGSYSCDTPPWLFKNLMDHINETHKDIDLIYFTGGIIDHTKWPVSIAENSDMISNTFRILSETFPNTTILPVIGNHEAVPQDAMSPPEDYISKSNFSTQWLYSLVSELWEPWVSSDTIKRQGYYSHTVNKKFKVIALNNNICYFLNWWLLYNTTYLREQLRFLSNELEEAEKNGQFVHIITHLPVGDNKCIEPWEISYNDLIIRFSHIIKGQFFGHTQTDELKIFYDTNDLPVNVGYNGASLSPYKNNNPNYKIMSVDSNTLDILDIETYYLNLNEAQRYPYKTPEWSKLYSMKTAYSLKDLSPRSINQMASNLTENQSLFDQYWRFLVRDGYPALKKGCDAECKQKIICKIFTTVSFSPRGKGCE